KSWCGSMGCAGTSNWTCATSKPRWKRCNWRPIRPIWRARNGWPPSWLTIWFVRPCCAPRCRKASHHSLYPSRIPAGAWNIGCAILAAPRPQFRPPGRGHSLKLANADYLAAADRVPTSPALSATCGNPSPRWSDHVPRPAKNSNDMPGNPSGIGRLACPTTRTVTNGDRLMKRRRCSWGPGSRVRAWARADALGSELKPDLEIVSDLWEFDLMADPQLRGCATADAAQADMAVISAGGGAEMPAHVKKWIEAWLGRKKDRPAAL